MIATGLLKLQFHSFKGQDDEPVPQKVNVKAADVQIQAELQNSEVELSEHDYYLPCAEKLIITVEGESKETQGYFQLPMKKMYEQSMKKNIITINCVVKDIISNNIKDKKFCALTISLVFLAGWSAKFDIFIYKVLLKQKKLETVEHQLYVQCTVGNVSNKSTVQKSSEEFQFPIKDWFPFKLESIPVDMKIAIKEQNVTLGQQIINPQQHFLFQSSKDVKDNELDMSSSQRDLKIFFKTKFTLVKNS